MVVWAAVIKTSTTVEPPSMTSALDVARDPALVNRFFVDELIQSAGGVLERASEGAQPRAIEEAVWNVVLPLGRALLAAGMAVACRRATRRWPPGSGPGTRRRSRRRFTSSAVHARTRMVLSAPTT